MKVQLITINYPPEISGAGHLIRELALEEHLHAVRKART